MRVCGLMMRGALSLGVFLLLWAAPAKASVEGEEIHYEVTTLGFQIGDVLVAQKAGGHANAPEIFMRIRRMSSPHFSGCTIAILNSNGRFFAGKT